MSGVKGLIPMADLFGHSPVCGSNAGLPPVIEASAAMHHLLSAVDSFLYSHHVSRDGHRAGPGNVRRGTYPLVPCTSNGAGHPGATSASIGERKWCSHSQAGKILSKVS